MSYMICHYLNAPNLKQFLLNSGVVESRVLHGTANREVNNQFVLNMRKCSEEYWKEVEDSAKEHGVVDFSKKNDDGSYGVRRDLTAQEIEELPYYPIFFNSDDEINWMCKWRNNDDPAFFISKLFPSISFKYDLDSEYDWCGQYTVLNGVFEESEDWKRHMEEIKCDENCDYHCEPDDTLPF